MNNPEVWNALTQIAVVVAGLAAGGTFTVPAINWLKKWMKLSGGKTLMLVASFATAITLSAAILDNTLGIGTVTPTTWGTTILAIILQATTRYNQLKDSLNDN